ncbi:hypothetical protein [Alkalimarinus alittae]|uniref:Haem-binding uptake Tiki superfamily ChaN domain-containing protein n=1 Tax=Alkalimarinus alittae TaxID=2961619 RepID=A0ABY6MYK5_9ALTE|nr:hypothetical protein [Alkalimarinus alittae]UZE94849.1 hypothetical protein NKI27_12250 [Alkalimarinus alittae]
MMPINNIKRCIQWLAGFVILGCSMSIQVSHAGSVTCGAKEAHSIKSLSALLTSQKDISFEPIAQERYQHAKALFSALFNMSDIESASLPVNGLPDSLNTLSDSAGFCLQWLRVKHMKQAHLVLLLMEREETAKGQGAYLFAMNKPLKFVIQAPHQYFDYKSGHLALQLFFEQNLRAVALNTVHRNQTDQSDLAHQANSLFSAFTEALPHKNTERYLIQVHGFSKKNRQTAEGKTADIILSNGSRSPSTFLINAQARMAQKTGFKTYLYGADIDELGGTQNSSLAILANTHQQSHFIHMELSAEARNKLRLSHALREALWSSWP